MPPENEAPENQDQPTPDAPEQPNNEAQPAGTEEESFTDSYSPDSLPEEAREAYDSAYKRMQGDYTRKTQEIAEERQQAQQAQVWYDALRDPETQADALALLGVELEDEDLPGDETVDPEDRLANLENYLASQEEAAEEAAEAEAVDQYIGSELEELQSKHGQQFTDEELSVLYYSALSNPDERGLPDVQGAYTLIDSAWKARQKAYAQSKRAPRAPGSGVPAGKKFDPANRRERLERTAEIVQAVNEGE